MATFTKVAGVSKLYVVDSGGTERDVSDVVTQVSIPKTSDAAETTTFTDEAQKRIGTLLDSNVSLSGPRDATAEGYFDGLIGASSRVRFFPEGSAEGKVYQDGTAVWTSLDTSAEVAGVPQFSIEGAGSGKFTRRTV